MYQSNFVLKLILSLIVKWELALFDEPTSGLDKNTIVLFEKNIKEWNNNDKTILITSHNQKWLKKITDKIFIIKNKKLNQLND